MPIYMKISRDKEFLIKGEVKTTPYRLWTEVEMAHTGRLRQAPSGAVTGGEGITLNTDVSVMLRNPDIVPFSLSYQADLPFDVQIDFLKMEEKSLQVYRSMKLTDTIVLSMQTDGYGEAQPFLNVIFNAARIEHTYRGSAGSGTPSWTFGAPGGSP